MAGPAFAEERVWRLGVLTPFDWAADTTMHNVMIPELARRGYVEGRNLVVLPRWGSNIDMEQLDRLAEDLSIGKPDVIVAVSPNAVAAAKKASPQTPIVASFTPDPVHEAIPAAHKFGILADLNGMEHTVEFQKAAASVGIEIGNYEVKGGDYRSALDAMRDAGVEGVIIQSSPIFHRDAAQLAALASERHLPTICEWRAMAVDGCLIGFGPDIAELRLRTADFIVRLFSGGDPAEMPFEQPTRFEMAINNKVARTIGVTVPPSVFVRADEVIE